MKKLLIAFLAALMLFSLCACGGDDVATSSEAESKTESSAPVSAVESEPESQAESSEAEAVFSVTVVDGDGNPVSGVMVQVCKDSCIPGKTGSDGVVNFNIEVTEGYKLSVLSCPDGYEYTGDAEIYLESGITEYTLEISAK